MKILLVSQDNSDQIQVGGKHIHQCILSDSWGAQGHEVRTAFPQAAELRLPRYQSVLYRLTRRWGRYPARFFAYYLSKLRAVLINRLNQVCADWEPDVISAQDPLAVMAVVEFYRGNGKSPPPVTLTLHGYYTWELFNYGYYGEQNRIAIYQYGQLMEREALQYVKRVITVDTRIRDYVRDELAYSGMTDVVFNAINLQPFKNPVKTGVAPACWRLLMTRRMVLKNGVIVAVEALAEVLGEFPNVKLTMLGDGPEAGNVRNRAEQLGISSSIEFLGNVSHKDVAGYYLKSDILLMPSIPSDGIEEATSLSMLEGMAAGNLVICSAIGGMKEIVHHNQTGFLVNANSAKDLASQILEIIRMQNTQRAKVIRDAQAYVWKNHNGTGHAAHILEMMCAS